MQTDTNDEIQCDGPVFTSLGFNLIEDKSCVDGSNPTDIRETLPNLGPLADNGGFSQSQLPNAGSPALDVVPADQCPAYDQRLALRQGVCDIGAVEQGGLFISAYMPRVHR